MDSDDRFGKPAKSGAAVKFEAQIRCSCGHTFKMFNEGSTRCPGCGSTVTLRVEETLIIDHTTRYDREAIDDKSHEEVSRDDGQGR